MTSRTGLGFTVTVDGNDLVVRNTIASYFGDREDVEVNKSDNGVGASGLVYYPDNQDFLGVSLPMGSNIVRLENSPLPEEGKIPWYTKVQVYSHATGKVVIAELIDEGPSGEIEPNRGIDLLPATLAALGLTKTAGLYTVDYRILGMAHLFTEA